MNKRDDAPRCPDCGGPMHPLPPIEGDHFEQARNLADLVWQCSVTFDAGSRPSISVACLTAALLFKRAAVQLRIAVGEVPGLAELYLTIARDIIAQRRAAALVHDETSN
jgi:hypothetical protein